jgi:peptidoglycan/LPS O-acetylase OafA/YrhL
MGCRIDSITYLRGLAIWSIFLFHVNGHLFGGQPDWFRTVSYQGVNAFFFASGFGLVRALTASYPAGAWSWRRWMARRISRIIPLYWTVLGACFALYATGVTGVCLTPNAAHPLLDFLSHAALVHVYSFDTCYSINSAWWFLGVLAPCYLVFPLIFPLLRRPWLRALLLTFSAIWVAVTWRWTGVNPQIAVSVTFFLIGMLYARTDLVRFEHLVCRYAPVAVPPIVVGAVFVLQYVSGTYARFSPVGLLLALMLVACLYAVAIFLATPPGILPATTAILRRFLAFSDRIAYALFLSHVPIVACVGNAFPGSRLGALIAVGVVLPPAYLLTRFDEGILRRWFAVSPPGAVESGVDRG